MELDPDVDLMNLLSLDLEYRLTIASRIDCECAPYFVYRREVLLPAILKQSKEQGKDPIDVFAAFARSVHDRHTNTLMTLEPFD